MDSSATKPKGLGPYAQFPFPRASSFFNAMSLRDRLTIEQNQQGGGEHLKFTSSAPFTPFYVTANLSQTSDPLEMYNARVKNRLLLLENPARESRAKKELGEKRAARVKERERKKTGKISKRQAREKGVWKFDESQAKWVLFLPVHYLWMGYMSELLALPPRPGKTQTAEAASKAMPSSSTMHPKLLKADYHGSIMTVHKAKNPFLVGVSGIVIHETENTFKVVTKDNKLKVLPKQKSIFSFSAPFYSVLPSGYTASTPFPLPLPSMDMNASKVKTVLDKPHIQFELYGNQFRFRAAERAGKKFKAKETVEL